MDKGIRYEKFKDEEVQVLLKEKDEIVKAGRALSKETETELEKKNQQIQKIKDKVKPMVNPYVDKMELGEFEVPTEVTVKDGEVLVQIVDQVESYKELLRKQKEDGNKKPSETSEKPVEVN